MNYCDLYNHLKQIYNYNDPVITIDNHIEIRNFEFKSENYKILTGEDQYFCSEHHLSFQDEKNNWVQTLLSRPATDVADSKVTENRQFRYSVFTPKGQNWVGSFWLEDIIWTWLIFGLGVRQG